jgi:ferrous iron transport protein B
MGIKTIALVGQPNAGKSTLFNVLSDIKTSTSNFPGTTVAIKESLINFNFNQYKLIDFPGLYSLNPSDIAEEVTTNYLINNDVDLIINVVDSTLLSRSLELTIELLELGIPMVISLNMQDEARRYGVNIDIDKLEQILNVPVIPTIGLFGKGVKRLITICDDVLNNGGEKPTQLNFSSNLETVINKLESSINKIEDHSKISSRFFAIRLLENPKLVPGEYYAETKSIVKNFEEEELIKQKRDGFEVVASERHHLAMNITHRVSKIEQKKAQPFAEKFDMALLHPVFGYFFLVLFFLIYFVVIFHVGNYITGIMEPLLEPIPSVYESLKEDYIFLWFTIDGVYQGIVGAIGIVLPYFLPLIFLTALFEDSGYMSRIAFLLDSFFHKIGLHGKSVAPFIMGLGCSVPALYATRIIENQRDRFITGILINFIPCSARLTVIFALSAAFTGPGWTALIFFYILFIIALNGKIMSVFFARPTGLVMEIPNLKLPVLSITFRKTYYNIMEFLRVAVPYLILGSIVMGWLYYFNVAEFVNKVLSPVVVYVLGLPEQLGSTLIFGFLRKELIVVMASQAMGVQSLAQLGLSTTQAVVFTIFIIFYIPCVSTFVVLWKEFGKKSVLITVILTISVAAISGVLFRLVLSLL